MSFSISSTPKFACHSVYSWCNDASLRAAMPWVHLDGDYTRKAKLLCRAVRLDDFTVGATVTTSPLIYRSVPTPERHFSLLLANGPRHIAVGGRRFVQQAGECVLTDSSGGVVGAYKQPHAAICLEIPARVVERLIPDAHDLDGLRFGTTSALSRMLSGLLLSIWCAVETGTLESDGRRAADALLRLIVRRGARPAAGDALDRSRRVSCERVKDYINSNIRDPRLSVQLVAERIGVTTRYLQLLFAEGDECVSDYIKRERLRGCLLDLRDAGFDHQSITDIAFSWGFNSAAHFSSSFRKVYGLSPRDYRSSGWDEIAASPLVDVEGPLVRAVQLLTRSPSPRPLILEGDP